MITDLHQRRKLLAEHPVIAAHACIIGKCCFRDLRKKNCIAILSVLLVLMSCFALYAADKRVVRVGAFNYYPGMFKDSDGSVKGFYIDALADIEGKENIRFEYLYGSWSEGLERIKAGEIDLITSVAYTPERAEFLDYGKTPLLTVWGVLYVLPGTEIDGITAVQGKKIAVMKNDFNARHFIELVKKFNISCQIIEVQGFDDVFKAISTKKADAGVVNSTFGAAKQKEFGLRSTGVVFNPFDIFFAVAKGKNNYLLEMLDDYLDSWKHQSDSPYAKAQQKWAHARDKIIHVIPRWLFTAVAALILLSLFAIAFIAILKKQVLSKSRDILLTSKRHQVLFDRQNAILAAVPDIIMEADRNKIYTWANQAGLAFFGDDVIGKEASVYFAGEQDTYEVIQPLFNKTTEVLYLESQQRRKDGAIRLLAWWCKSLVDEQGVVTGTLSTARDITESKQTEKALQASEQKYRTLFDHAPDGIVVTDASGRYIDVNAAICRMLGYNRNELIGMHASSIAATIDSPHSDHAFTAVRSGGDYHREWRFRRKDGSSLIAEVVAAQTPEGDPIEIIRDITERKKTEQYLHQSRRAALNIMNDAVEARERLEQTNKALSASEETIKRLNAELENRVIERTVQLEAANKELEAFSYSVSHDLRAPLRHISGYVDLLNNKFREALPDKARHYLNTIAASADQMGTLIDDLLQFSRTGRQEMHGVAMDMNGLVKEVIESLKPDTIHKNLVWSVAELPEVFGDYALLKQVWVNLLDNAIKFTQNKEQARIEIGCSQESDHWVFFVRDNGVGFDMQYAQKLFGVFHRLHSQKSFPGTGIGLANVQRIIHKHAGRVWADAQPEKGAVFYFTLPIGPTI